MQFPNALSGVKKIFLAEIISLAATALGLVVSAIFAAENSTVNEAIAILSIAVMVVSLIAFIIKLIGLNEARKDEVGFSKAFFIVFAGIIVSVIGSFFAEGSLGGDLFKTLGNICEFLITFFIIGGIMNLAEKLNDAEMIAKGKKILAMVITAWAIAIVAGLVGTLLGGSDTALAIAGVLIIISAVVEVVAYVIYLIYLAKAKKMLEA